MNSNSTIIIGDGFVEVKDKWENANKKMYSFIVENIKKRSDNRNKILVRKACTGIRLEEFTFVNMLKSVEYPFKVYTFAPSDMHIMHDQLFDIDTMKNAFSVGIYISIGDYTAVFCADIPDRVFNVLTRRDIPTYIDYIKIPHHGSEKSLNVLKFFDNDVKVACTTVKTSSLLPRRETIDKYKERSENLFCTNNLNTDEQEEEWGVVETCFSIDSKEIVIRPYGNAKEIK